jgi:hypothetical protein
LAVGPLLKLRSEEIVITETTFQALFVFTAVAFAILWGRNLLSIGISRDKFYTATEGGVIYLAGLERKRHPSSSPPATTKRSMCKALLPRIAAQQRSAADAAARRARSVRF